MEFTLNIKLNNATEKEKAQQRLSESTGQNISTTKKNTDVDLNNKEESPIAKSVAVGYIIQEGKQVAQNIATKTIGSYGVRHGDAALQNKLNNATTLVTETASAGTGIAAAYGAGGWVGAIVATLVSAIDKAVDIAYNSAEYQTLQLERKANEIRQSERLGRLATDRNRGR